MELSTILLFLLYGAAIVFIIQFMMSKNTSTVYIQRETPVVYPDAVYTDSSWWPWSSGSYNYWPYWAGWWSGGGDGGYWRGRDRWHHGGHPRMHFGGGSSGRVGGLYGPIGIPASRPGGGGIGRGGMGGGHGGGGHGGGGHGRR